MTIDERLEKLAERHEALTHTVELMAAQDAEHRKQWEERAALTDARLDRAIRLATQEGRTERRRRQQAIAEIDGKISQLASAQLVTEQTLKSFIDSLHRGGNGHT